jgi:uncharacterized protein (DUF58 family)
MTAAHSTSPTARVFVDPRTLMRLGSLELRARVVVEGFRSGLHRSPYHGFSVEFTEYRPYTAGDDPRYLDWRVLARSDRSYVKKYEDETNLRCHLLLDRSRSMTYGSIGYTKADYAATLAATLAHFLQTQGDAVGLMTFDETVREFLPARSRAQHLRPLLIAMEKPASGSATDLAAPLERFLRIVRRRGMVVLISDFLAPLDRLEEGLTMLAACGHETMVFLVHDPAELSLGFDRPAVFEDLETGRRLTVDPASLATEYRERFEAHLRQVRVAADRLGLSLAALTTDQPLEHALFAFLQARAQRGRRGRGATPARGGGA